MFKRKINIPTVSQKSPAYEHDCQELLFPAADIKCLNNENFISTRAVPKTKAYAVVLRKVLQLSAKAQVERYFYDNNEV